MLLPGSLFSGKFQLLATIRSSHPWLPNPFHSKEFKLMGAEFLKFTKHNKGMKSRTPEYLCKDQHHSKGGAKNTSPLPSYRPHHTQPQYLASSNSHPGNTRLNQLFTCKNHFASISYPYHNLHMNQSSAGLSSGNCFSTLDSPRECEVTVQKTVALHVCTELPPHE